MYAKVLHISWKLRCRNIMRGVGVMQVGSNFAVFGQKSQIWTDLREMWQQQKFSLLPVKFANIGPGVRHYRTKNLKLDP